MRWFFVCLALLFLTLAIDASLSVLGNKEGVRIKEYMDGQTPAKEAGLPAGAVITRLNGMPVLTKKDFKKAFEKARPGDRMQVIAGKEYYITLGDRDGKALLGVFVENAVSWPHPFLEILAVVSKFLPWIAAVAGAIALFCRKHSVLNLHSFNVADVAMTGIALAYGAQELNPLARTVMDAVGFLPVAVMKLSIVLAVSLMMTKLKLHKSLRACTSIYAGVLVLNIVQFFQIFL